MDERRAVEIVLETLGDRRLRDGAEPTAVVERRGTAFEVTLTWSSEPPTVFVVTRDGTIAQIID